jgi:integrase/recombinase XerD
MLFGIMPSKQHHTTTATYCVQKMQLVHLYKTGKEAAQVGVPFLLDGIMVPLTVPNAWLREGAGDGGKCSPHTLRTYAYALYDFLSYLAEKKIDWREVTNDHLVQYRDIQDQNPSSHTKKALNRATINARICRVDAFYTFAVEEGFLEKYPFKRKKVRSYLPADRDFLGHLGNSREIEVPSAVFERLSGPEIKWCPFSVVTAWINSMTDWRDKLIGKITYRTGMRREEVANWKVSELPGRASADPSGLEVTCEIRGKGGKKREVVLARRDFLELHDYIRIERARLMRKTRAKHDFIFVGRRGQRLQPSYLNRIFKKVSDKRGIHITPHMLRHSFAVFALQHYKEIGVRHPEKLLQKRLGHKRLSTTEIYMHLTDEALVEEARGNASLIEKFLRGDEHETE